MPRKLVLLIYAVIAALIVYASVKYLLPALIPFIIALFFSFIMEPIIAVLQRRVKLPRGIATFIAMIVVYGGIVFAFTIILFKLVAELVYISLSLPDVVADTRIYFQNLDLLEKATAFYVNLPPYVTSSLEQNVTSIAANLQGFITKAVNSILQYVSLVPSTIVVLLVTGVATYFLARDRQVIFRKLMGLIPEPWDKKAVEVIREVAAAFMSYLRAQIVLISITIIISVSGLYIIGAEYALTIGLLMGFLDLLPVVGPSLVYLPWIVWSFVIGNTAFGIKMIVLYVILLTVRQISETKIVSASLGLYPLATLIAMYVGLKLIGVIGLVLGPVLLIAIQAMFKAGVFSNKVK